MKFFEHSANIPDELIHAVSGGNVVFLCGAGISARVGLPNYKDLTEGIYRYLGESICNERAELLTYMRGEYDHALRSLEKRTMRSGFGYSVREAAVSLLTLKGSIDTEAHRDLLMLSRDNEGRHRLITTNFDTVFERAVKKYRLDNLKSHSGKSIPKPGTIEDYGIMHLHGRIKDEELGIETSELVITSADFGDAYLRDGWASRYMEDRMRINSLVLVGYSANDVALRLLFAALDADKNRFPDLKQIYSIIKRKEESSAYWLSMGIKPIEFDSYSLIYETLAEWAKYVQDTRTYSCERVRAILGINDQPMNPNNNNNGFVAKNKTPIDVSAFEQNQLNFFFQEHNIISSFADIQLSLAWLPWLSEKNLINSDNQLTEWFEKKIREVEAVRDVVENIHYFDSRVDTFQRLIEQQKQELPNGLYNSWRLIIKHIKSSRRHYLPGEEWNILQRRFDSNDLEEVITLLADFLRPIPTIGRIINEDVNNLYVETPTDLMTVEFKVPGWINAKKILSKWPLKANAAIEERCLLYITKSLEEALSEANFAGVESNVLMGQSDRNVCSVADYEQNKNRIGFFAIVQVLARIWERLVNKNESIALQVLHLWSRSNHRLVRRLSLFASGNPSISATDAAKILMQLPRGEIFVPNTTVEVYRLLKTKWEKFTPEQQKNIEKLIIKGPPESWFSTKPNPKNKKDMLLMDRGRFDLICYLESVGIKLGEEITNLKIEIANRWPDWKLHSTEIAGCYSWQQGIFLAVGNAAKLMDTADKELISKAMELDADKFRKYEDWEAFCRRSPVRAFNGLKIHAKNESLPIVYCVRYLWCASEINDKNIIAEIANFLLAIPDDKFTEFVAPVAYWLCKYEKFINEERLWPLWDKITRVGMNTNQEIGVYADSLNSPSGYLAEVLLKKLFNTTDDGETYRQVQRRLKKIIEADGLFGKWARARISYETTYLFQRMPDLTSKYLLPLFNWTSPDAHLAWSAWSRSAYIGSPKLMEMLKIPFTALFERNDVEDNLIQVYSRWLTIMTLANQSKNMGYPISLMEARTVVRKVGPRGMKGVAYQLIDEMEKVELTEKALKWKNLVGPVFKNIWPLDIDRQTSDLSNDLVRLLLNTEEAFPEAAKLIIPYICPDDEYYGLTSIYEIHEATDAIFSSAPEAVLDLIVAVVSGTSPRKVHNLDKVLKRVLDQEPELKHTNKYQKLINYT